jgi:antitoxin component YwqK of YwqJK toxin-antitoxin module
MEFDGEGTLLYAGNFLDNLRDGYGVLYDRNGGIVFKGNFLKGLKQGKGTVFRPNATIVYSGGFEQDLFTGEGELFYRNGYLMYTGRFEENLRNGPGTEFHENGNIGFEGQFKDNNFHGQGLLYNLDGVKLYNGMFVDGKKNGRGTEFGETRTEIYVGQFKNGLYHGRGKTFYMHKDMNKEEAAYFNDFDGKFQKGIRVSGDILYRNGQIFYTGKLAQEMPDGENVTLYHENGVVQYQGPMKIGIKQGHGKSWYKNGSIKFIGTYDKNDMIQGALYSKLGKLQSRWFSQPPPDTPLYEVEDRH